MGVEYSNIFILTITSLIFTRYFPVDYKKEIPYVKISDFPWTLLGGVIAGLFILKISTYISEDDVKGKRQVRYILLCVLVWCMFFGMFWVYMAVCTPIFCYDDSDGG